MISLTLLAALTPSLLGDATDDAPAGPGWPDYRGPARDGHALVEDIPLRWSEDEHVRWKTPIHGRGWSSPVVLEGRIWLTTATPDGTELSVLGVDAATGEVLVDRILFEVEEPQEVHPLNSYASPSPVLDGERVFVTFGTYGTACLDASTGETVWEREDLHCDHIVGPGSSPLSYGHRLFLHFDGGDEQFVVALDKATGKTLWETVRSAELEPLEPDFRKSYSTPVIARTGGRPILVSTGAQATYGYEPSTGKELWRVRHKGFSVSTRPVVLEDRVLVCTGFMRSELWAIRLGGQGDVTETHVAWRNRRGIPTMPSAVVHDGRAFLVSDQGMASCVDVESGETLWQERLNAEFSASPLIAGERVYYFDREGKTTVLRSADEFVKLAEAELDDGFMASPAVLGKALLLRSKTHLYRIEE